MDPFTILVLGGIGWVATQASAGVVGNSADRVFTAAVRGLRDRLPALAGTPAGDDLARGLRRAQLRALERVILDYREVGRRGVLAELARRDDAFFEQALAFSRSRALPAAPLDVSAWRDGGPLSPGLAGEAIVTVAAGATLVEDAVLAELGSTLNGPPVPDGFAEHYRSGGRGRPGFLALFGIYFAEQVKEDAAFREVLHTGLMLQSAASLAELGSLVMRLKERFGGALSQVESGVAGIADEQRAHTAKLDAILELVAAQKGVSPEPLRAILERLGEAGVPDDQIPARLAVKADEYLALREQWSKLGEATPDVEAVRRDALDLIERGDLEGARRLFTDARVVIRTAREKRAREEAAMLAGEAEVDQLQLRYLEAADRFAEAETLVASFDANARFYYIFKQAHSVQRYGDEFGDNKAMRTAIKLWRQAARLRPRAEKPLVWASIQHNLGLALRILGGRERGIARLEESIKVYRAALKERTRARVPMEWAITQNALGTALLILGERERGTGRLEEAVNAYRAALEEQTREGMPLEWAMTQTDLGNALLALGRSESGTIRLEEAVDAYRAALQALPRERVPMEWATTQNNLGNALLALGKRESGTARLEEAVKTYRAVLEEWVRERVPLDWASTQNNLGGALLALGERESGTTRLEEAVKAYRAALQEWTRERVPLDWAMTQSNLGSALVALGERERGTERLEEAVTVFRASLEEQTRERRPLAWATIQNNLGAALRSLGAREVGTARLEEAVEACRAALEERTRDLVPLDWAMTQNNLGSALVALSEREGGTARLEEAVKAYRASVGIFELTSAEYYKTLTGAALRSARNLLEEQKRIEWMLRCRLQQ